MEKIFEVPLEELGDIFLKVSREMGMMSSIIIEKDYWLVRVLSILYSDSEFFGQHVFKGGTSLSKCYHYIKRFSEDVDITISKKHLGFNEEDKEVEGLGSSRRNKYFNKLIGAAVKHVDTISEKLTLTLQEKLGVGGWSLVKDVNDPQIIYFEYPRCCEQLMYAENNYIVPRIMLEFGCRGDVVPTASMGINTYIEDCFSVIFEKQFVQVNTLSHIRTFWEKIAILHKLAHQPEEKDYRPRMARHYYDIVMMLNEISFKDLKGEVGLLKEVIGHNKAYFRSRQASFETAKPGTLKLIPSAQQLSMLQKDFAAM